MNISEADVMRVAELANLELTAEERQRIAKDLNSILGYVGRLSQLDTSGVEPMAQVATSAQIGGTANPSAWREDEIEALRKSFSREQALANAPEADGTFFQVPKVIER
jgi:aspartyl-tRNA(Asn)/glutamyl-tRNA(Gln) amidotransferase subunit C